MLVPMSPQTIIIIHQDKIRELECQIEHQRIAKERGMQNQPPAWYPQPAQWIMAKIVSYARRKPQAPECC